MKITNCNLCGVFKSLAFEE